MKYTKFNISNYKGIPNITLDLTKKPSTNIFTLVGLNESGKTTILEAINCFANDVSKDSAHSLIPKNLQYGFNDSITIKAELELEESDKHYIISYLQKKYKFNITQMNDFIEIEKKYNYKNSVPLDNEDWKETLWFTTFIGKTKKAANPKSLDEWSEQAWADIINEIEIKLLPKILYYPDFLFKFPEKIYLEKSESKDLVQEEYRSILQDILDSIENNLNLEDHLLDRMKNKEKKAYKESLEQLLNKIAEKLNGDILKEWDEIFGSGQKKEVEVNYEKDNEDKYFIELKIKQGSDSYSINDRSLGFRWFFSFLIFTAFRKSRSSDPGETLFLLDEPASNLHQRSQQKLLKSLSKIVSDCKLIYATHSHHLINPKWLAGTYIVRNQAINYGNPEALNVTSTKIDAILYKNFVAQYPNEEDHFKPILDSLQYAPSKLEMVPYTIFTEGKNDYYTFKYIAEVIFNSKYKLHFYPGASVNKYDSVFRLYITWDRKFIALFDSDPAGIKAKRGYQNDIGPEINDKIFTLEDINNRWKNIETEDLFSDTEKIKIIRQCFNNHKKEDGVNKSKFNTAIQDLYINNKHIRLSKSTSGKFERIFAFISEKLNS